MGGKPGFPSGSDWSPGNGVRGSEEATVSRWYRGGPENEGIGYYREDREWRSEAHLTA